VSKDPSDTTWNGIPLDVSTGQLLRNLNDVDPSGNYCQYEQVLLQSGLAFAHMLVDHDGTVMADFLCKHLGMPDDVASVIIASAGRSPVEAHLQ
jgi:hypothetical protein